MVEVRVGDEDVDALDLVEDRPARHRPAQSGQAAPRVDHHQVRPVEQRVAGRVVPDRGAEGNEAP